MNRTIAIVAVLAVLVTACGDGTSAAGSAATDGDATSAPRTVTVVIPNAHDLQWLSFWVASGAGYFRDEGLAVEAVSPPAPFEAPRYLTEGEADVAVLPAPMYLTAIGDGQPVLVFANLLSNDPVNLVARPEVARERGLSTDLPLAERLEAMRGMRIGVAPGPPTRLRVLFDSVGLDADRDIEMVIVRGDEQNEAFGDGRVDALYVHTPYLERALIEQGAVTVVDQIGGEVPELSGSVHHALVTTEDYASANPDTLVAMARAVHRAQQLIHADPAATADAVRRSGVELLEPDALDTTIATYGPAVPETPEVSVVGMRRALELFPAILEAPDLSDEELGAHVDGRFARDATRGSP